jgi:YggT family protein
VVVTILIWLIEAYVVVLLLRAVLSWFPIHGDSPLAQLQRGLVAATEPVLAPVRRVLPPLQIGGTGIDLSMIVVVILLEVIARII